MQRSESYLDQHGMYWLGRMDRQGRFRKNNRKALGRVDPRMDLRVNEIRLK